PGSSCAVLREDNEKGHDLEIAAAGEFTLDDVGAARREQAGDGALFLLADDGGNRAREELLVRLHVAAEAGRLVEPLASLNLRRVATDAELLQVVENLLGLRMREQHIPVLSDMDEVMRVEGIVGVGGLGCVALRAQAEDDTGRYGILSIGPARGDSVAS